MEAPTFPELLDSYLDALEERLTNLTRDYPGQRTALDILREKFAATKLAPCLNPWSEIVILARRLTLFRANKPVRRAPAPIPVTLTRHLANMIVHLCIAPQSHLRNIEYYGLRSETKREVVVRKWLRKDPNGKHS